jgi:hypothetical protein
LGLEASQTRDKKHQQQRHTNSVVEEGILGYKPKRRMLMPALIRKNAPDYADRVNLMKKNKNSMEANGRPKDKVRINGTIEVHT